MGGNDKNLSSNHCPLLFSTTTRLRFSDSSLEDKLFLGEWGKGSFSPVLVVGDLLSFAEETADEAEVVVHKR